MGCNVLEVEVHVDDIQARCEQSALDVDEMYLEEKVHAAASKKPLTVDRSLVGHIPHGRPGRLHHVVADARLHSSSRENVELTIA